jgi:O-antigen/teichoic acid export membrane protein
MASAKARFLPNVASNLAQVLTGLATSFFLVRIQISHLGVAGNGAWVLVASLGDLLGLLELGVGSAVLTLASEARGRGDEAGASSVLRVARRFYLLAAVVAVGVSAALAVWLPALFELSTANLGQARQALVIVGVDTAATLATSPFRLALQARHRFDLINWCAMGRWLARFVLLWWGLERFPSLVFLAGVSLVVGSLANVITSLAGARQESLLRPSASTSDGEIPRRVAAYAVWVVLAMLGSRLAYSADTLIIGAFLGTVEITCYFAAWKVVEVIRTIGQAVVPFFLPLASERAAQGRGEIVPVLFYQGVRAVIAVTYPLCAVTLGLGDVLLEAWLGISFARYYPLLVLLLAPQVAIMTVYPSGPIAYGLARHRPMVIYGLASALANLLLSMALVRPLGIYGVALGTAITLVPCAVINLWFHPWLIGFELRTYLRIVARGVAVLLLGIGVLRFVHLLLRGVWPQLAVGLVVALLVAAGFVLWELTAAERTELFAAARLAVRSAAGKVAQRGEEDPHL